MNALRLSHQELRTQGKAPWLWMFLVLCCPLSCGDGNSSDDVGSTRVDLAADSDADREASSQGDEGGGDSRPQDADHVGGELSCQLTGLDCLHDSRSDDIDDLEGVQADSVGELPCSDCPSGAIDCLSKAAYRYCEQEPNGCWKWSEVNVCDFEKECICMASEQGMCVPEVGVCSCLPDCQGKECGSDGCGGACGIGCASPLQCDFVTGDCVCDCSEEPPAPVCGANLTTYANSCEAECDGVFDYVAGECVECNCSDEELATPQLCAVSAAIPCGKTYENFCEMKCDIHNLQCEDYLDCPEVKFIGPCSDKCGPCEACPQDYSPVCATDGYTYWNACDLKVCNDWTGADLACKGECNDEADCEGCLDICSPVCGEIAGFSKPFMNACLLECKEAVQVNEAECCSLCPLGGQWVCGQDFKAYRNECVLNCWAPEAAPPQYEIPLDDQGSFLLHGCEECHCSMGQGEYLPVCGSDYRTYYNPCMLACAHDAAPNVVKATPACAEKCGPGTCPCPSETGGEVIIGELAFGWQGDTGRRGVCGGDDQTYGNKCSAAYAGVEVVDSKWCESCEIACAGYPYQPVCCADGVTYPNPCVPAKCNGSPHVAPCAAGVCPQGGE